MFKDILNLLQKQHSLFSERHKSFTNDSGFLISYLYDLCKNRVTYRLLLKPYLLILLIYHIDR